MPHAKLGADALLDLVTEALKTEIGAAVPADKRYLVAMLANAVEIARREMQGEAEAAEFALLDSIYEEGEGTLVRLAADIRRETVTDDNFPDLRRRLREQVVAELSVRNPRFLKSAGIKT
jgi:hypothetical protein